MPTVTDIKEYPSTNTKPAVIIKGQAGKKIRIEEVSLQLTAGKEGITNSTTVLINGTAYAAWNYKLAKYSEVLTYNKYPYVVDEGKDAILTWSVKTDNTKYPAKMKMASYTYSYVDVAGTPDTPSEETKSYLVIECKESEAATLTAKIKELAPDAGINVLSKYQT